jgi:hypothetical protein
MMNGERLGLNVRAVLLCLLDWQPIAFFRWGVRKRTAISGSERMTVGGRWGGVW